MMSSRVRRQATLAEDHTNVEEPDTNELNINEATDNEANLNCPNSNEPNLKEPTSVVSLNVSTNDKGKDEEEERKIDEIPVDDGSPVNISTLLYACASAKVFRHNSTKLSFNIKLAFLWCFVIPFPFYIKLALGFILKNEYFGLKYGSILTEGPLSISPYFTGTVSSITFIITVIIIPLLIILILRPNDLTKELTSVGISYADRKIERKLVSDRVFIGDEVLQRLKISKQLLLNILSLGKAPIHVYQAIQNSCDHCKKTGTRRSVRLFWGLLAFISSICAVMCSVIMAAICLLLLTFFSIIVVASLSPYFMIMWYFRDRLTRRRRLVLVSFLIIVSIVGLVMFRFSQGKPLLQAFNPLVLLLLTILGPLRLLFSSSRFVIKMCGYTIMGLICNAEIAAPIAVFFVTLASYLRNRYFDSKNQCKRVKEIIWQEWQQRIKDSLDTGKLNEQEKPKVTNDAIPKKLFWYVCNGDENRVFSLERETLRLLRDVAIIFLTAILALCAIFFPTNSYRISAVASTIALFVSVKIPMALLRETDNFNR